ncbi:MAG: transcriptional regulator [Burkholderiales bacterium]|nr:transcriptional regulator [Burkholderiales bacterium]
MKTVKSNTLPRAVENFNQLPDAALIGSPALMALTGKSRATIWRWVNIGILPKPKKFSRTSQNVWTVGEVRHALSQAV